MLKIDILSLRLTSCLFLLLKLLFDHDSAGGRLVFHPEGLIMPN